MVARKRPLAALASSAASFDTRVSPSRSSMALKAIARRPTSSRRTTSTRPLRSPSATRAVESISNCKGFSSDRNCQIWTAAAASRKAVAMAAINQPMRAWLACSFSVEKPRRRVPRRASEVSPDSHPMPPSRCGDTTCRVTSINRPGGGAPGRETNTGRPVDSSRNSTNCTCSLAIALRAIRSSSWVSPTSMANWLCAARKSASAPARRSTWRCRSWL